MTWNIEYTNEFGDWWAVLAEGVQEDMAAVVELPAEHGPGLRFPFSFGVVGSRHDHLRELRIQSGGQPVRVFYAFDPRRTAIPLIGGDKTGDNRFYKRFVPLADRLSDEHLRELKEEGLIE